LKKIICFKRLIELTLINLVFNSLLLPPQPAGCVNVPGAPFASFEKYAKHFSNPGFVGTKPNEALTQVLVEKIKTI
jgi:hypothetical protein